MARSKTTKVRRLALTESSLSKLKGLLQTAKTYLADRDYVEQLDEKLEDAEVVAPDQLPTDVVEVETSVRITDLDRSEQRVYKLVFPRDANYGNHVSVIAPLGAALLGSRVGDVVEVCAPARKRRLRVDGIVNDDVAA